MAVIKSSVNRCDECGTQTNVVCSQVQDDTVKVRRHKCPSCGHAQFSVELFIESKHVYCLKKYRMREPALKRLISALYA